MGLGLGGGARNLHVLTFLVLLRAALCHENDVLMLVNQCLLLLHLLLLELKILLSQQAPVKQLD